MKSSRSCTRSKVNVLPILDFDPNCAMTPCSGLVVFAALFRRLKLRTRLARCFAHLDGHSIYSYSRLYLLLIVQILLGRPRLRDADLLRDDPLLARIIGVQTLPHHTQLSRMLTAQDARSLAHLHHLNSDLVLDRIEAQPLRRLTTDFDGSVQSSTGHAEGTAVGFNKKKKGARSYYPLYCTLAQTGQVFDFLHRSGNVYDNNGAKTFVADCHQRIREAMPGLKLEARFDSAFYNIEMVEYLDKHDVDFTISVPFARFPALKAKVETQQNWARVNETWSVAESAWFPASWPRHYRLLLIRKRSLVQRKGPLQLDLFEPRSYIYEYKVIVTNKPQSAGAVLHFHNGRGSQEKILGEGKQFAAFDAVATRRRAGNEAFTLAGVLAHNLGRELQMSHQTPRSYTHLKRPAKWIFESLGTLRKRLIWRAGRFVRPQGRLTLKIVAPFDVQQDMEEYLEALGAVR